MARHRVRGWHYIAVAGLAAGAAVGVGLHGQATKTSTDPRIDASIGYAQLCPHANTAARRNVPWSIRATILARYHVTDPSTVEVDHVVSLELAGTNDPSNLWAEPRPRANEVDLIENQLHAQVCARSLTLAAAQHQIIALKEAEGAP